uniref:Amino acid transporter transmembrane domain-containing protein n=1 Tax=Populus alba TaxID=43335 RepID=A0A4V6A790_POPAL|nr:hypothetical protein D5086_0000209520 [Populus alba]
MECLKAKEGESHSQLPHPEEPHVPAPPSLELVLMDSMLYQVLGYSQFPTPFSRRMLSLILLFCSSSSMLVSNLPGYILEVKPGFVLLHCPCDLANNMLMVSGSMKMCVLLNWGGLPTTLSLFTFCYCGHAVFPTLCNSMKDRSQFSKVLLICFVTSTITYGSMAVLGYLMYGEYFEVSSDLKPTNQKNRFQNWQYIPLLVNPLTKYANSDRDQHRGCGTNNPLFWIRDGFYRCIFEASLSPCCYPACATSGLTNLREVLG